MRQKLMQVCDVLAQGFTTGALARDAAGMIVDPLDDRAAKWCVIGAVMKVFGRTDDAVMCLSQLRRVVFAASSANGVARREFSFRED